MSKPAKKISTTTEKKLFKGRIFSKRVLPTANTKVITLNKERYKNEALPICAGRKATSTGEKLSFRLHVAGISLGAAPNEIPADQAVIKNLNKGGRFVIVIGPSGVQFRD